MYVCIRFTEKELKQICGEDTIERYRRAMDRYQTSDNETIAKREKKHRDKIRKKLSKHIRESGIFSDGIADRFWISEDCYINPFSGESVTEYVEFTATLDV